MDDSILITIKKMLGIEEDDKSFDFEILMHINSALGVLRQLGVGTGLNTYSENSVWEDYINEPFLDLVRQYVYYKVKMAFDPPTSSIPADAIKTQIQELEWRILVEKENQNEANQSNGGDKCIT